jgi:alkylmercury lyase
LSAGYGSLTEASKTESPADHRQLHKHFKERNKRMMMMRSQALQDIIKGHTDFVADHPEPFRVALPLWRLLARGKPVALEELASALHRSLQETQTLLQTWDHHLDDEGHIVAAGVSLAPTAHQFHLDELVLYTWCALDALSYPAVLGRSARVISTCPVTGQEIRLTVTPEAILDLSPASAVVSVRLSGEDVDTSTIQEDVCNEGFFFVSHDVASTLPSRHSLALLSVEEAAELGRAMARQVLAL